jgi:hypothetical protein
MGKSSKIYTQRKMRGQKTKREGRDGINREGADEDVPVSRKEKPLPGNLLVSGNGFYYYLA